MKIVSRSSPRVKGNAEMAPEEQRVKLSLLFARARQVRLRHENRDGGGRAQKESNGFGQRRGVQAAGERRSQGRPQKEIERPGDRGERQRREPAPCRRRESVEQDDQAAH